MTVITGKLSGTYNRPTNYLISTLLQELFITSWIYDLIVFLFFRRVKQNETLKEETNTGKSSVLFVKY